MRILDTSLRIIDPNDRRFFSFSEMHEATIDTVRRISKGINEQGASMVLLIISTAAIIFWQWKKKKDKQEKKKYE